eukprot:265873_1
MSTKVQKQTNVNTEQENNVSMEQADYNMESIPQTWKDRWINVLYANSEGENCDDFVDLVVNYYESSLGFAGFLAGFEFLGVSGITIEDDVTELAAFFMTLAFLLSIFSAMLLVIQLAWFRFYKGFPTKVVLDVVSKFYYFMDIANQVVIGSLIFFILSVMIIARFEFTFVRKHSHGQKK